MEPPVMCRVSICTYEQVGDERYWIHDRNKVVHQYMLEQLCINHLDKVHIVLVRRLHL